MLVYQRVSWDILGPTAFLRRVTFDGKHGFYGVNHQEMRIFNGL